MSPVTVFTGPDPQITDFWKIFGHSWFQYSTGPSGDQTGRVDGLMRAALDIEYNNWRNFAMSGARASQNNRSVGGWTRVVNGYTPPARGAPYAPDGGGTLICYGVNDLGQYGGQHAWVKSTYIEAMRAIISRCRASTIWEDSNATRHTTIGANWSNSGSGLDLSSGGTTRLLTALGTAAANTITFTIPADYTGGTIAFAFLRRPTGSTGTTNTAGTVTWGGTALSANAANGTTTYLGNGVDSAFFEHGYMVKRITGLTSANAGQTITFQATQLDAGGNLFYDCAWIESPTPAPVLLFNIARLTATGYANPFYTAWTGTESSKDADVVAVNASLASMVAEFDGMVQIIDADAAVGKDAASFSDGIHPNEFGGGKLVDATLAARRRLTPPAGAIGQTLGMNSPSPRSASMRKPRRTNDYQMVTVRDASYATYTPVAGDLFAYPFEITESRDTYMSLHMVVTTVGTAAATLRWAIYDDVGWSGYPQQLVNGTDPTSSTALSVATTPAAPSLRSSTLNSGIGFVADPGLYWLALKVDTIGTGQVWRSLTGQAIYMPLQSTTGLNTTYPYAVGWKLTGQGSAALTGTFPTTGAVTATGPLVMLLKTKGFL